MYLIPYLLLHISHYIFVIAYFSLLFVITYFSLHISYCIFIITYFLSQIFNFIFLIWFIRFCMLADFFVFSISQDAFISLLISSIFAAARKKICSKRSLT